MERHPAGYCVNGSLQIHNLQEGGSGRVGYLYCQFRTRRPRMAHRAADFEWKDSGHVFQDDAVIARLLVLMLLAGGLLPAPALAQLQMTIKPSLPGLPTDEKADEKIY